MHQTDTDFDARTSPFRLELLTHCYRMVGSLHDAEDLVHDTMLRAWRAFDRYDERRASLRTWLYRIATNVCLTALEGRARRPLPSGLAGPSDDLAPAMVLDRDVPWLEPFPGRRMTVQDADPASVLLARRGMRLAFVAAVQYLPARQRAVLLLRDVLEWPAAEVAEMLDTTTAAVNSTLQRARARLAETGVDADQVDEPSDAETRAVVDRYVAAFEKADITALRDLLTADAVFEMPPFRQWFAGRDAYCRFLGEIFERRGANWRMLHTTGNGQPAVGTYLRTDGETYRAHSIQVFTVTRTGLAHNISFTDADFFPMFDLPVCLPPS